LFDEKVLTEGYLSHSDGDAIKTIIYGNPSLREKIEHRFTPWNKLRIKLFQKHKCYSMG